MKLNRFFVIAIIICSLLLTAIKGFKDYREFHQIFFVINLKSSSWGVCQIFFDLGHGHNQQDLFTNQIPDKTFHKYSFPLPSSEIKSLRFDPIDVSAKVEIKDARIENKLGDLLKSIPLKDFLPIQQINKTTVSNNTLFIDTYVNANDPILLIDNSHLEFKSDWRKFLLQHSLIILGYFLLCFLFLSGLYYLITYLNQKLYIANGLRKLKIYISSNPKISIVFIGSFAAILSCYPVVFCGMSFVSPTLSGVYQLYDRPPFLPGFPPSSTVENCRGADVGPSPWYTVPTTVVEYESCFKYSEFPFWNRYVGGGVPLFAQGQSMIGDILHWIPISLGGSAVSWDIKFLISKAIFAVGIGLLIFLFTGNFLAGSLLAFSSCFLGFFAYRFNHPAFFVLTYSPWVVIIWKQLGLVLTLQEKNFHKCLIYGILLAIITWLQLNAGSPKEGVIMACFMQALGILSFLDIVRHRFGFIRAILFAIGFEIAIIIISAPYWLLFIDALGKSFTFYDEPKVITYPIWKILGFFDNFFFQQLDGTLGAPSTNLFVFLCMSGAIACLKWNKSILFYGTMIMFFLAMSIAYGLIPQSILISIPFINKIQHLFNTFSMPMLVLGLIISGFGIQYYLEASVKHKKIIHFFVLSIFTGLCFIYLLSIISFQPKIAYFGKTIWLILPFVGVLLCMSLILYRNAGGQSLNTSTLLIFIFCFLLLHVRHGMHLMTGIEPVDLFIMNPTERPNFSNKSCSVEYVKNKINSRNIPSRVIGEGFVMFPGYNSIVDLEGIVSVEPLRNKHFEKLLDIVDYPDIGWGWMRAIKRDQIVDHASSLDLLNIGYIFAYPGTKVPTSLKLIHSSDLDVWESETVWPRAFFVNEVLNIHNSFEISERLTNNKKLPFAAVENLQIPKYIPQQIDTAFKFTNATQYILTNNSTSFSVKATGPGIIVLSESYYPKDFIALINGKPVDYFRVNEAFKGIWVDKPGKYNVIFTYRPEKLHQALILSVIGMFLLLILVIFPFRFKAIAKINK